MKPANDPSQDYRLIVQAGYDACAAAYERARQSQDESALELLFERLQPGSKVLDVGCGAGIPVTRTLARCFRVTGIDLSVGMIQRARVNVPQAEFIQSDVMHVDLPAGHYDAVVAFYSIFHLPREEHPLLFQRIYRWLKHSGYLLATLSQFNEAAYTEDDFFGVRMYWSNFSLGEYKQILTTTGFNLLESDIIGHGYKRGDQVEDEYHPLVFAQKK